MKIKSTLAVAGAALVAAAAEFHVDPSATPDGDGTSARPFATLAAARDGVRAARKAGKIAKDERVDVVLAAGDYLLADGLVLAPEDGGASAASPVTWRAACPGKARLLGARRIPNAAFAPVSDAAVLARLAEEARGKVWQADVSGLFPKGVPSMKDSFGGTPSAPLLFVNHGFGTLARWPNAEYTSFFKRVDRGEKIRMTSGGGSVCKPGACIDSDPRAKRACG